MGHCTYGHNAELAMLAGSNVKVYILIQYKASASCPVHSFGSKYVARRTVPRIKTSESLLGFCVLSVAAP